MPEPRRDDFYVGYLSAPPGVVRFVTAAAVVLLVATAAFSALLSRAQQGPGDGVWDSGVAREFVGRVDASPYPLIRVVDPADGRVRTLLLVEIGKFGGGRRAAPLDGRIARISGWRIERDGRAMIEMEPASPESALRAADGVPAADVERLGAARSEMLGVVTLQGEIVDSKCYLGAMKPGEGKTHKQCATLCIAGGIPPMFVTVDRSGRRSYYVLTDADGRGLAGEVLRRRVLPLVADAVEVSGMIERRDDLVILRADLPSLRRL